MNELTPNCLDNIVGNDDLKEVIKINLDACKKTSSPYPNSIFEGPHGCCKSTFCHIIAETLGVRILEAHGGNLSSIKSVLPYFGRLANQGGILFVDELHRVTPIVQEIFFTAIIPPYYVDIGKGLPVLKMQPFSFLGATTHSGMILPPLLNRMGHIHSLYFYSTNELVQIAKTNCAKLNIRMTNDAMINISSRSRGTPRTLNHFLQWIRNYSISKSLSLIDGNTVETCMKLLQIDSEGLTKQDKLYMSILSKNIPMGLNSIVATLGLSRETIEFSIEAFLLRIGKIKRTSKGRILT